MTHNARRFKLRHRRVDFRIYRPRRFLLTQNEAAFFRALLPLVAGRFHISCKVRLADLVTIPDADWQMGHANRIAQKHIDFVLACPQSFRIIAAIELDDRSHQRIERRKRDAFINQLFSETGISIIRVPARWAYDADIIAKYFTEAAISFTR